MAYHLKRAKEAAKLAREAERVNVGSLTVLPGVRSIVMGEAVGEMPSEIDWERIEAREAIPYGVELGSGDEEGKKRRGWMDQLVKGVMRYGEPSLMGIAAALMSDGRGGSYNLAETEYWMERDVDEFRVRVEMAHKVFKGRFIMAVIDRADKPYLPKEFHRDNLPLFGVLNAFVSEHFKRGGAQVNIATAADGIEFSKTLIVVGEQMEAGIAAAQEVKALPDGSEVSDG